MDNQSLNHLERVGNILAKERIYLLAGAGLSCRVGIPGWNDLLREFAEEYGKRPASSMNRAQEIRRLAERADLELFEVMMNDTQGQISLIDVLKKHFCVDKCDSIHKELLNLPFGGVITTNYDTCFESACRKYGVCPELSDTRWFCFPEYNHRTIDMNKLFDGNKFLLHMHGCFCYGGPFEVENIILAPSQYSKFYKREEIRTILSTLSKEHVIFLGTSLTDRYFLDNVRELRKPKNDNDRANAKAWFRFCDNGEDCFQIRDEEDFIMYHIHYKLGDNGFSDAIMKMVEAFDVRKRPVSAFVDPSKISVREDMR